MVRFRFWPGTYIRDRLYMEKSSVSQRIIDLSQQFIADRYRVSTALKIYYIYMIQIITVIIEGYVTF